MKAIVDTCVWSLALRRAKPVATEDPLRALLKQRIDDQKVVIIGAIRQEILSGIRDKGQFEKVKNRLRSFPDLPVELESYELAAKLFNKCKSRGVQGSNADFLICAVAQCHRLSIFTTDRDFLRFRDILGVSLVEHECWG